MRLAQVELRAAEPIGEPGPDRHKFGAEHGPEEGVGAGLIGDADDAVFEGEAGVLSFHG